MRVREFTQDDAHIFAPAEQEVLLSEVALVLEMMSEVYGVLGLAYELELSTRPEERIGEEAVWDIAEGALEEALRRSGRPWRVNAGDGAFYGPKIDVHVKDRMGRRWQCGTVQVDFNLPARFGLRYADGTVPVMLHRVIYGSIERFIGILIEHFKGAFPLWLAPEQVRLLPVSEAYIGYGERLREEYEAAGIRVSMDARNETIRKRVKVAWLDKIPYTIVVGQRESEGAELTVKKLGGGEMRLPSRYFVRYLQGKVLRKDIKY